MRLRTLLKRANHLSMLSVAKDLGNWTSVSLSGEGRPPTPVTESVVLENHCEVSPKLALDDQLTEIKTGGEMLWASQGIAYDVGSV